MFSKTGNGTSRQTAGAAGEQLALRYLKRRGYKLLERNYRALRCEIDLIMQHGEFTVFVEVKARTPGVYGGGREAVNTKKQQNIIKAALHYMQQKGLMEAHIRFDVAEVDLVCARVTHIPNAFGA